MRKGSLSAVRVASARAVVSRHFRSSQPGTESAVDSEGAYVRPRQTLTLLEELALRAGGEAAKAVAIPVPPPAPAKRGRGRPRKGGV